ncbi:Cell cycle serine/threonine-protein kinase cdc5/MSD2 [Podochytrium sp. JEL0797]|nr:Cell cycle serine/threonine-protein kinase cdc5/MSD2 [Podochytrium sp. JEL0797]
MEHPPVPPSRAPTTAAPSSRHGLPPPDSIYDKKSGETYRLGRLLGEGGFARCYEFFKKNGERIAAKVIRKASLTSSKQKHKLFAEIKIHQLMHHPAIVQFQHVFEDDDNVYILLEVCDNGTMVEMLRARKRLTEPEVRYYMHHLLHGVNYMHQHRIIHRDLKLGNMFLANDMRLKVGDFGLAAMIKHDGERKKTICGTPNYIAPEVLFDAQNGHSYEVDLWSLGVVMYTLAIGRPPFQTKEVKAIYKNIKENNFTFPTKTPISASAKSVIESLLNNNPLQRPTIEEVLTFPFFTHETVPYSIPVSALQSVPSLSDLNIVAGRSAGAGGWKVTERVVEVGSPRTKVGAEATRAAAVVASLPPLAVEVSKPDVVHVVAPAAEGEGGVVRQMAALNVSQPRQQQQQAQVQEKHYQRDEEGENRGGRGSSGAIDRVRLQHRESGASIGSNGASERKGGAALCEIRSQNQTSPRVLRTSTISNSPMEIKPPTALEKPKPIPASPLQLHSVQEHPSPQQPLTPTTRQNYPPSASSPASAQRHQDPPKSTLDIMYRTICNTIAAVDSEGWSCPSHGDEDELEPDLFIIKWIDYSNKYGLGYQLQDGSIGVYFNDSTSILLAADEEHIEYLYYETGREGGAGTKMHRRPYTMSSHPEELKKKVTLLKHFGGYMQENLFKGVAGEETGRGGAAAACKTSDLTFLTKYLRTKHGVIFRLSNQVVQINLFDHTKLILSQNATVVTYIDKNRDMTTKRLDVFLASRQREVVDRILYAKDILNQMILKKAKKAAV